MSRDSLTSALPPNVTGTVVTVGTFDGVHRGHQDVLTHLVTRARAIGSKSLLVTFDPHPLEIVNPTAAPPLLTVGSEKTEILAETGVDYVAVLPFTKSLQRYSAEQFVDVVLRERMRMGELLIGYDHGFGRGRQGDVEVLQALGARRGFRVEVVPAVMTPDGFPISSTMIRRAIAGGDLRRAREALGRLYALGATVIRGEGRGRALGYPTLNLEPPPDRKLLPPEGVYAVRVQTPLGPADGMMNLGPRPTFGDLRRSLEVHLLDTSADLYDAHVRVEFVARLRDTRRFDGAEALIAQLRRDAEAARHALTAIGGPGNLLDSSHNLTSSP